MSEQKLSSMLISIGAGLRCEVGALVSGVGGSVTREVAPMECADWSIWLGGLSARKVKRSKVEL